MKKYQKKTYLNKYTNDCCQYREEDDDDEKIELQTMIQCFGQIKIANI